MRIASNVASFANAAGMFRIGGAPRVDDCEIASDRGGETGLRDSGEKLGLP